MKIGLEIPIDEPASVTAVIGGRRRALGFMDDEDAVDDDDGGDSAKRSGRGTGVGERFRRELTMTTGAIVEVMKQARTSAASTPRTIPS